MRLTATRIDAGGDLSHRKELVLEKLQIASKCQSLLELEFASKNRAVTATLISSLHLVFRFQRVQEPELCI